MKEIFVGLVLLGMLVSGVAYGENKQYQINIDQQKKEGTAGCRRTVWDYETRALDADRHHCRA